jgi:HPt (histidine-containing phosphotransfer) domain-containing protein
VVAPETRGAATDREDGDPALDPEALDALRKLQRSGGPDIVARVVGIYLEDAPQLLSRVRAAIADTNSEALRQAAHAMKSSSANVGAVRLAELCKRLERLGREGDSRAAAGLLTAVEEAFTAACGALASSAGKGVQP